jgi:hypothetical protein
MKKIPRVHSQLSVRFLCAQVAARSEEAAGNIHNGEYDRKNDEHERTRSPADFVDDCGL